MRPTGLIIQDFEWDQESKGEVWKETEKGIEYWVPSVEASPGEGDPAGGSFDWVSFGGERQETIVKRAESTWHFL